MPFPFILPEGWIFVASHSREITVIIPVLSCHFTPHMRISFEKNTKETERRRAFLRELIEVF